MRSLLSILNRRISIINALLFNKAACSDVPISSCLESIFQLYGLRKIFIRKTLAFEQEFNNNKVTIKDTTVYWPLGADIYQLVDIYFEIFENNSHRFDSEGSEISDGDVVLDAGCCEGYFAIKALRQGAKKVFGPITKT